MTAITADEITRLSDGLYDAVYDSDRLPAMMHELEESVGAVKSTFAVFEERLTGGELFFANCGEPFAMAALAPANPLITPIIEGAAGDVLTNHLVPRFEHTPFFSSWLRPQNVQSFGTIVTLRDGALRGIFGFAFEGNTVGDDALDTLAALAPTLNRVTRLQLGAGALRLTETRASFDRMGIGAIIVDASGRVAALNEAADAILSIPGGGLTLERGVLGAGTVAEQKALLGLVLAATQDGETGMQPAGDMVLRAGPDDVPVLAIRVSPIRSAFAYGLPIGRAAMLLLQPIGAHLPAGFGARIQSMFGLSQIETALGLALVEGQTPREVAVARQVTIHTVRTQLAQLYRKTGTTRQSQLVATLLRVMPFAG